MIGGIYSRSRIESALLRSVVSDCYRIMPGRHLATPLGTVPADSRFCSRNVGYTVLYASPDFATAFIETVDVGISGHALQAVHEAAGAGAKGRPPPQVPTCEWLHALVFSKGSLFSGLNNLKDISLDPRYATPCGYTDEDLDRVFGREERNLLGIRDERA